MVILWHEKEKTEQKCSNKYEEYLFVRGNKTMKELILAIETGGTKIQLVLGDKNGEILYRYRAKVEREKGFRGILDTVLSSIPHMSEKAKELSGITNYKYVAAFRNDLSRQLFSGNVKKVYLDFDKVYENTPAVEAYRLGKYLKEHAPFVGLGNLHPIMKQLRLIKKPCEIEAMKKAETITKAGIEAMMKTSKPGMYEYQYKAEFDYALAQRGVLSPGFPSIISSGKNNFKIHYYDYRGQAQDGDMILNDVGAVWDYEINDVSRAFPCNGRFNDRQKLLYECIYNTSEYMFSTLKPGVPLLDVDKIIRKYTFEQLKEAGVCKNFEDIGTYMWHGGAHHVGFDVHDVVEGSGLAVPGVVFCVDIGVYHEEWGIGFRLEDNCLITEDGCENLSRAIPRQIDEIEAFMGRR